MGSQINPNPNPAGKTLTINNGDYNSEKFINYGTLLNQENSLLYNRNNGSLNNFATFDNGGTLFVETVAEINNNAMINNTGNIYNDGTVNNDAGFVNGNRFEVDEGLIENSGVFNNFGQFANYGRISNTGNIVLCPRFSGNTPETSCHFFNYSVIDTTTGIIDNTKNPNGASGFINMRTGKIIGKSHIKGPWTDHGNISPGHSTGGMFFEGNYYKRGGSHEIELAGEYNGKGDQDLTKYDWIEVAGDVELAGELDVNLIDGFELSLGNSFVIVKVDGDLSGQYDGLKEGDSVGRFKSGNGGTLELFVTYQGGDGNDIELYTKSVSGVLPESLRDPRMIGSDADDSLTGTSADEVIFGANGDDVLLGRSGDDHVTGGNGNDRLDGGSGDDHLKGDRGADTYKLSTGNDVIIGFSFAENDRISVADGVELSMTQVGDDLSLTADGIDTTLLDVDKDEFLAAVVIDYI